MNIKGYEQLYELGFPVQKNAILFRRLEDIPAGHIDIYQDNPCWAMRGFDYKNSSVYDNPYVLRETNGFHGFNRRELKKTFKNVNRELDLKSIPIEDRIYIMCELFTDSNTQLSGIAFRDRAIIYIDIKNGNRPSKRDWKADHSIKTLLDSNGKIVKIENPEEKFIPLVNTICNDLMILGERTCLDFSQLTDGYFFYHDMFKVR